MTTDEAPGEVADTRLKIGSKWNEWDWCCSTQAMLDARNEADAERKADVLATLREQQGGETENKSAAGRPPLSRKGGGKRGMSSSKRDDKIGAGSLVLPTPLKAGPGNDYQTPGGLGGDRYGNPSPVARHISPADADEKVIRDKRPGNTSSKTRKKRSFMSTPDKEEIETVTMNIDTNSSNSGISSLSKRQRRVEVLGTAMASPMPNMKTVSPTNMNTNTG